MNKAIKTSTHSKISSWIPALCKDKNLGLYIQPDSYFSNKPNKTSDVDIPDFAGSS